MRAMALDTLQRPLRLAEMLRPKPQPDEVLIQAAKPPAKPVMLFDGDCGLCVFWIRRWQRATGERVEYLPFQDRRALERFPELSREQLLLAVHLIEPGGTVCRGAEAVCRSLATNPARQWPLRWYQKSPRFAALAERAYRFVAEHRPLAAALTDTLWPESKQRNADSTQDLGCNPQRKPPAGRPR